MLSWFRLGVKCNTANLQIWVFCKVGSIDELIDLLQISWLALALGRLSVKHCTVGDCYKWHPQEFASFSRDPHNKDRVVLTLILPHD